MAKRKNFTSPFGVAVFPYLTSPDTKFDAEGEYKIDLRLSIEDGQEFMDALDAEVQTSFDAAYEKAKPAVQKKMIKANPYSMEEDDEGDETGNVIFKFKLKAHVTPRQGDAFDQKPSLFDMNGKFEGDSIFGGSICAVNYQVIPYFFAKDKAAGVSLRLRAVQVKELVAGGVSESNSGFDFEESDDDGVADAPSGDDDNPDF